MHSSGIFQINNKWVEIFRTAYHPSAKENADRGWDGWGWSILDQNGNRTGLKGVFETPQQALAEAKRELADD